MDASPDFLSQHLSPEGTKRWPLGNRVGFEPITVLWVCFLLLRQPYVWAISHLSSHSDLWQALVFIYFYLSFFPFRFICLVELGHCMKNGVYIVYIMYINYWFTLIYTWLVRNLLISTQNVNALKGNQGFKISFP